MIWNLPKCCTWSASVCHLTYYLLWACAYPSYHLCLVVLVIVGIYLVEWLFSNEEVFSVALCFCSCSFQLTCRLLLVVFLLSSFLSKSCRLFFVFLYSPSSPFLPSVKVTLVPHLVLSSCFILVTCVAFPSPALLCLKCSAVRPTCCLSSRYPWLNISSLSPSVQPVVFPLWKFLVFGILVLALVIVWIFGVLWVSIMWHDIPVASTPLFSCLWWEGL